MSASLRDKLLPYTQTLLHNCARATVLTSETQFQDDLSTSQDKTLAVLVELDVEIKHLLRHVLRPRAQRPPPNALFTSVVLGCTWAVNLFEQRLQLYRCSSKGKRFVCSSWTRLVETLQQYTLNLQELNAALGPVTPSPISDVSCLQRVFDKQKNDVQRELEAQMRFEAQQWDEVPDTQGYMEVDPDYPSSTYATPPSSIADGDINDELPPIPGPPLQSSSISPNEQYYLQMAMENARTEERTRIYNTLKTIWITEREAPEKRSGYLLRAIKLNSVDSVNLLLDLGAEVNQPCENDLPLCLAARSGYDRIVETLLDRGAEIDMPTAYGNTALLSAAGAGHTSTIMLLLVRNANKEARSTSHLCKGYTPLMRAVRSGHMHAIRVLVDAGASVATLTDAGESLLHVAIQGGRKEIIEEVFLLQHQPGIADKNGNTELHLAAMKGLVEVSKLLLAKMGSLVRNTNLNQETPLHYAVKARRCELVRLFLEEGAFVECPDENGKTPLHLAVQADSQEIIQLLLNVNASPCMRDKDGKTPMHYAVDSSRGDIVRLLAQKMPPVVNTKDKNKQTPLHYAVKSLNTEIVRLLLSLRATANCKDRAGKAPLEYIMEMPPSEEEMAIRLIQEFLCVHEKGRPLTTIYGFPALSKAAREGRLRFIHEFCQHDPRLANEIPTLESDFEPALHEAIKFGHKESVEMLCLLPEADKNILDREGNTPLHQAVIHWQDGLLAMLICTGADKDCPHGKTGLPPLHFAVQLQSLKKVEELLNNKADPEKRINGKQCTWCRENNRPPGMNSRCVLQAIPEHRRTQDYSSISRTLSQSIRPYLAGSASTNSSRKRKAKNYPQMGSRAST
ncbi:hypothetical protein EYZ11_002244 [Aspergillus tanneri]|uniref:Uncharacterized protein n=1 Tax=Aspergillus tanneri TaxID=1220188 RepID=A0A4S3JR98_9EURO|nr:hypothetical protein EYZ11_002244 [Aspergillus tanneri]